MKARATVTFKGKVQGVFFRVNALKFALAVPNITGWVKNMPDRSVAAVFEGEREAITKVISDCVTKQPYARVDEHTIEWGGYTGEYYDFQIID
jgi:acylphosphatase